MQIVIDGKNRAKAAYHISGKLRSSTGLQTGIAVNLAGQIKKLLDAHRTVDKVYFLWEGAKCWRHDFYSEYKGNRTYAATPEDPNENSWPAQVALMQSVLEKLPVRYCISSSLEADDIAGRIALTATEKTLLVSDDYDYLQLIRPGVAVYQPKIDRVVTISNLEEITGYRSTEEIIDMFSICGDSGDGIPGIVGVGEKGAMSYLRGELNETSAKYKKIKAWMDDPNGYIRSRTLFDMRHIPAHLYNDYTTEIREFDQVGLTALGKRMEWNTLFRNWDLWVGLFSRLH